MAKIFLLGEREHSASGSLKNAGFKLSGNMPDRAGKMPALPR